jgi:hypothetical protein
MAYRNHKISNAFMKRLSKFSFAALILFITLCASTSKSFSMPGDPLKFNTDMKYKDSTLTFLDGKTVKYRAYENIYYVSNVADSEYQYLNFYVPESAYKNNGKIPIFLKTNVGGYFASKASAPTNTDASGRALLEGYVVVIPGARGWNSKVTKQDGNTVYTGRAPAAIVDLKAAIRYLRHNDEAMPGDAERIITDGTSAGGAMSSLMGATSNNPAYEPYLQALGAAKERDDVFASVVFCPIIDLEHGDMSYEWLYNGTNTKARALSQDQIAISNELAAQYPTYLNSLQLKTPNGTLLTADNYRDYIKSFLVQSAQRARNGGADMPANAGIKLNTGFRGSPGEFVLDIDMDTYLNYVVTKQPLKTPPAFDQINVLIPNATPENNEFGDETGKAVNFTDYSLRKVTKNPNATVDTAIKRKVYLLNPMNFIGDDKSTTTKNWYIRNGALDRDAAFNISINLYTKLFNHGFNPNFALAWNRGHMGDYNLDDVFGWIDKVVKEAKK